MCACRTARRRRVQARHVRGRKMDKVVAKYMANAKRKAQGK